MFRTQLETSEYYDFVLTTDLVMTRDYNNYKLLDIDLSKGFCSENTKKIEDSTEILNISLTGYDNFFIPFGDGTINPNITYQYNEDDTFCLHPVSGYVTNIQYDYDTQPNFIQLNGGFFQGSFNYKNYPVEFMPNRFRLGWTINTTIKLPINNSLSGVLNDLNPDSTGFLFYIGTRAENKFIDSTDIEISFIEDSYDIKFLDVNNEYSHGYYELNGEKYFGFFNITNGIVYTGREYTDESVKLQKYRNFSDIINNAFGVRISEDGRIGYRSIYATDPCYTGTVIDAVSGVTTNDFVDYSSECDNFTTKKIITKYFTIEESMTRNSVIDLYDNRFLNVSVVFEREFPLNSDCLLKHSKFKMGSLKIYINGFRVFNNQNFVEVIPHPLNEKDELQEGVPFNISFGGGTQGLIESIPIDSDKSIYDNLNTFFGGTFTGGVKDFEMYSVPLYGVELWYIIDKKFNNIGINRIKGGRRIFI